MIEVLASATVAPYSNIWIHQANTLYALTYTMLDNNWVAVNKKNLRLS